MCFQSTYPKMCFFRLYTGFMQKMACLTAVKCIPTVASRSLIQNVEVVTSILIALHDPEKVWLTNYFSKVCGVCTYIFSFTLHI
ncbi:hypothetical protein RchiOBHm_Chr6g0282721 [Rosa chinensis]|uniref:Uncharacterized protein n=1 Tax=Rosa chinensis TaxID=74649 RepID=A0A2P6PTT8_ROSCH|nr:hypothetical protein RchiOBHm_Chr6g0282721 [Rosa chinensis]